MSDPGPSADQVAARYGLTTAEAERRLAEVGRNTVPEPPPPSILWRVGRQLTDPLILLLLAAAVVTTALRDIPDTVVIMLVVVVNTAIGVTQEIRADRAVAELIRLAAPTARVIRDGTQRVVPAADLVPGDWVLLSAGDIVPADCALHTAHQLTIDESVVTGESLPVSRSAGDEIAAGTVLVTGRAAGSVIRTGEDSTLGRIGSLVAATRPAPTPLQRQLARLGRVLGVTVVVLSGVVFLFGVARGLPWEDMIITAVSLVVAAVPESLPAVVTLALALGARHMARNRAIVRRLHAVETLGSVTTIASDKTGTITQNRMAVRYARPSRDELYTVEGEGYAPYGELRRDGQPVTADELPADVVALARAGALCNDAEVEAREGAEGTEWRAVGDPLEAALVAFAGRCGLDVSRLRRQWPRVAERPFDSERRRMSTVHATPDGGHLTVCKGAPEAVLNPAVLADPEPVIDAARRSAEEFAAEGFRLLAVASANRWEPEERGLTLHGLVAIGDPVRPEAVGAASRLAGAGIRLIMITGDHPATAKSIAGQLGIWQDGDTVVTGNELVAGKVDEDRARVYARTHPEQKLGIVERLQSAGHVVAMTGDGVNDAPALKRADIGVAMGRSGSEAARQASDLILADDNLATLVTAVREGRRVYGNIRRFLWYGLSGGFAEILVMLAGPFFGLVVPLLPAQILWINLLTHGLPGVALGREPAEGDAMRRRPRPPDQPVLGAGLWWRILLTGLVLSAVVLGIGVAAFHRGLPWQSMVFTVLGLGQLSIALGVRAHHTRGTTWNWWLPAAVAASAVLQLAGVYLPGLRLLLGTEPLTAGELASCVLAGLVPGLVVAAQRALIRYRREVRHAT